MVQSSQISLNKSGLVMPNLDTPSLDNLGLQVRSDLDKSSQDMSDQAKSQGIRSSEKF